MERQVLRGDRVVAQNDPVVCKEESASFIKELLTLHIAVEDVLAKLDVRPLLRRLRAPSIDHMNGQAAGLAFLPGVTQGESLISDAFRERYVQGLGNGPESEALRKGMEVHTVGSITTTAVTTP